MMSRTIIRKDPRQLFGRLGLVVLVAAWFPTSCFGDEVIFKDKGAHIGTVLEEDQQSVTIRFPKEAIQSVVRTKQGAPLAQKPDTQLSEKLDQLQKRIERLERKQEEPKQTGLSPLLLPRSEIKPEEGKGVGILSPPDTSPKSSVQEQLQREESGRVQGVILWQGKPLVNGKVRIELEKYTGVSLASAKKMLSGNGPGSSETEPGISLTTQTDSQGQYTFEKVPPGTYRLYWSPDFKTGWVHRLREKPDFEVLSGQAAYMNIPEKQSVLKVKDKK